jgi:predicted nuclease with TOPRIM domain
MELIIEFLRDHGLAGVGFIGIWYILRYYIGKDIKETRAGVQSAQDLHYSLKNYVESCEEEIRDTLKEHEKELAMIKQEAHHLAGDIKSSMARIETNLAEHTRKEEIYQRDMTNFMGYVYRHIGPSGPVPTLLGVEEKKAK